MNYHLDLSTNNQKKLMDWVYRENKPYEIICTTHNNKAFVRDERQANNKLPFYKPDKFVFCTRLNFEWSKHIDVEKELWEYPIENRIRPDRKRSLDKLDLGDYRLLSYTTSWNRKLK